MPTFPFTSRLFRYKLLLREPLQIGPVRLTHREGLLLSLRDQDGHQGFGEIAPLPGLHLETLSQVEETLQNSTPILYPSLRFGLEMLWWNYLARKQQSSQPSPLQTSSPLYPFEPSALLPAPSSYLPLQALLAGPIETLLEQAQQRQKEGFFRFKVKVGRASLQEDIERILRLQEYLGEDVALRLDPNRAWDLDQARHFLRATQGCKIDYLEEPLRDASLLPQLVEETGISIALDESLADLDPHMADPRLSCAKAIVLKPHVLGGVQITERWLQWAQEHQCAAVFSSCFETGLGLTFLALWAATRQPHIPAGLDTRRWFAQDLLPPWPPQAQLDLSKIAQQRDAFEPMLHPTVKELPLSPQALHAVLPFSDIAV